MGFLKNFLRGIVMGISETIPGVSGGTMAVLMGIYDKLIGAVSNIKSQFKKSVKLLLPLVLGMAAAIIGASHVIPKLLEEYPMQINFLFMGLVIGMMPMLWKGACKGGFKAKNFLAFVVLLALMLILACFYFKTDTSIISAMSPAVFVRFTIVGFLAAVCLILPGVSGSMIMVVFGIYASVFAAIRTFNIIMLVPVAVGVLLGLLLGAKAIDYCLRTYTNATYFAILGLVGGSVVPLLQHSFFPDNDLFKKAFHMPDTVTVIVALVLLAAGIFFSWLLTSDKISKNKKSAEA